VRRTHVARDVRAGCFECHNSEAKWLDPKPKERHHDSTGHETWAEVVMNVYYGRKDKTA
jgi:hypothetical protein